MISRHEKILPWRNFFTHGYAHGALLRLRRKEVTREEIEEELKLRQEKFGDEKEVREILNEMIKKSVNSFSINNKDKK